MKKVSVFYLLASCFILGAPLYVFKGAVACGMAKPLGYKEIRPNIFIAKASSRSNASLDFISKGAQRVSDTFGATIASPMIILTDSAQESDKFFASDTATPHVSPFGTCLVVGPKGQNVDVMAHEFVHAEIYARLGWVAWVLEMPRWFEEGVALLVDFREPFLPQNISLEDSEITAVKTIFYGHHFYTDNAFKNYQAARLAVESVDKTEFYANLARIKQGQKFDAVFGIGN
ncbi:hypothetical protein [Arsukibacterium perlucidum]|uniref:hypothetical protein n=1 Tax=Arsukibacterium perlucidum TaxID=368811 RepID=UPI000364666A|nr:hypothetical protein [Arsukibacterium perlucidum]